MHADPSFSENLYTPSKRFIPLQSLCLYSYSSLPAYMSTIFCPDARAQYSSPLLTGYGCRTRFFTRESDDLPCFAGMLASVIVTGRAFLPANPMVCPVSRVCLLQLQLPDALLYPRILVFSLPRALSVYTSVVIPVGMC